MASTRNVLTFVNTTAIAYTQNSAFLPGSWHHAIVVLFTNVRQDITSIGDEGFFNRLGNSDCKCGVGERACSPGRALLQEPQLP